MSTDIPQIELKPVRLTSPESTRDSTRTIPSIPIQTPSLKDQTMTITPRLFMALYDYDPEAMSPNPNSEEELPFREGQTLKV